IHPASQAESANWQSARKRKSTQKLRSFLQKWTKFPAGSDEGSPLGRSIAFSLLILLGSTGAIFLGALVCDLSCAGFSALASIIGIGGTVGFCLLVFSIFNQIFRIQSVEDRIGGGALAVIGAVGVFLLLGPLFSGATAMVWLTHTLAIVGILGLLSGLGNHLRKKGAVSPDGN
ncbi:MAG: hypothetical protein AAF206_32270, partial [Bacteroidota bacterium]